MKTKLSSSTASKGAKKLFGYSDTRPSLDLANDHLPDNFPPAIIPKLLFVEVRKLGAPFKCSLEYGKVRYCLSLELNEAERNCPENKCLENFYKGCETPYAVYEERKKREKLIDASIRECLSLFWPFLISDYDQRLDETPHAELDGVKPIFRIQITTVNGVLCKRQRLSYPPKKSVPNPVVCMSLFAMSEVEILAEVFPHVFKVKVQGSVYCLKTVDRKFPKHFVDEAKSLAKLPRHKNLIHLVGLLSAGEGMVSGMVLPYIQGVPLRCVTSATTREKEQWKMAITEALKVVHDSDVVWGDVKPDNIIINPERDEPILIDFGGGYTRGWIDKELRETKEGDSQALAKILTFIDKIGSEEKIRRWGGLEMIPLNFSYRSKIFDG